MLPPRVVYRFVIVFIFQKLLEALNRPGVEAAGPALRLPDLGPRLFQGLVLKVVPLEQFPLFFRELLDGRAHPPPHLLQLNPLVGREGLIRHLEAIGAIEAGPEDHRQPSDGVRDPLHLILEAATGPIAIGEVAEVGIGALGAGAGTLEHAHLPQAVVDGALDPIVREGEEVGANPGVEALGGLEQANLAPRDELLHLELGVELFAHLGRE